MARPTKYKSPKERREAQLEQKRRSAIKSRREARGLDPLAPYAGEVSTSAKLTWGKVREIRKLHRELDWALKTLAHKFSVSEFTIGAILRNEIWKE